MNDFALNILPLEKDHVLLWLEEKVKRRDTMVSLFYG